MKSISTIAALAGALLLSTAAQAKTSCYVGAQLGYSVASTDASLDIASNALYPGSPAIPGLVTVDGFSADGASGGFLGGCDYRMDRILVGAWGDFAWHGADFSAGLNTNPVAPINAGLEMSIDRQWSIGGRAGVFVTDATLIYGLIGYTKVDTSDLTYSGSAFGTPFSGSFAVEDLDGVVYGGGMEVDVGNGLVLGAEYRLTVLDSTDVQIIPNVASLNLDSEIHTVRAVAKYKFSFAD